MIKFEALRFFMKIEILDFVTEQYFRIICNKFEEQFDVSNNSSQKPLTCNVHHEASCAGEVWHSCVCGLDNS